MDKIVFTPSDVVAIILGISASIVTISGAITAISGWISKAKQPEVKQNEKIDKLRIRLDNHDVILANYDRFLQNDDIRLKQIETSSRITQRGLLALLKHSINGEDIEGLKKAEKDLEEYLISKD